MKSDASFYLQSINLMRMLEMKRGLASNGRHAHLGALTTKATGQLDILRRVVNINNLFYQSIIIYLGLDSDTLSVDGSQVGVW